MKGMDFLEIFSKTDCANIVPAIAGLWLERFCASCEADIFRKPFRYKLQCLKFVILLLKHLIILDYFKNNNRLHEISGLRACRASVHKKSRSKTAAF